MKTIFVSISNPPVYRNFALFPNSVVEQISNDKNYRMVLLVRKNLFPKFVEILSSSKSRTIKIIAWFFW